jgi:hypothetical protein
MKNTCALTLFALLTVPLQAQVPPGATSTYPFCGNANDMTNTNHGLVAGATLTADRFGVPNNAYYFNGQPNCYINLGANSNLKRKSGSISVWARPHTFSYLGSGYLLNPIILTKNQPGNNCYEGYAIGLVTAYGPAQFHATITQPFCNQVNAIYGTVNYQQWYHIVLTWDTDSLCLFVDGIQRQSLYKGFANTYLAGDSVMVGNSANVQNDRFFHGEIDDLIFYPYKLSQAQVTALYNDTTMSLCTVGIADETGTATLDVFPNPALNGELTIRGLPANPTGIIEIVNVSGQLMHRAEACEKPSLPFLAPGMYILRYIDERGPVTRKLIIR